MGMLSGEWEDRLAHWIRTLKQDFYEELGEISWEAFRTKEKLSPKELESLELLPVQPGYTWGECWEYCWFRGTFRLPEKAQGQRIVLDLKPGGESCLFVNGREFGTYRADWIEEPHHYMVDNTISRCADAGDVYQICMETYAGQDFPNCETGYCATGPVLPGSSWSSLTEGSRRTLGRCTYGIWREEAYQLYMDVSTLFKLLKVLEESSLRAAEAAEALKEFTRIVDFEQDGDARLACYREAADALKPVMEAVNGTTAPLFWAIGNAHLDLAWLWPVEETERKAERTFAAQLRLLEEYPEYRFIQSQPACMKCAAFTIRNYLKGSGMQSKRGTGLLTGPCGWSRIPISPEGNPWYVSCCMARGTIRRSWGWKAMCSGCLIPLAIARRFPKSWQASA